MGLITASGEARTTEPQCWSSMSSGALGRATRPCSGPSTHRSIMLETAAGMSVVAGRYGGTQAMGDVLRSSCASGTSTTSSCMNQGTDAGGASGLGTFSCAGSAPPNARGAARRIRGIAAIPDVLSGAYWARSGARTARLATHPAATVARCMEAKIYVTCAGLPSDRRRRRLFCDHWR